MSNVEKQYGLIEIKTGKKLTVNDVFNNDSDSGGENDGSRLKKSNLPKMDAVLKRQTKIEMERALEEDPTVYQYDEVYDEMNQTKQEIEKAKTNVERKPKYIHNLMRTAEKRKQENERRLERQIQKEREAEGDMFKDKEEFITSSYKQKLEEFKKAEEEEKKMEYIESVMDVSKQQDLGGFYRHLYRETVANEGKEKSEIANTEDKEVNKPDIKSDVPKQSERNYRKRNSAESIDGEEKKAKKDSSSSSSDSDSSSDSSSSSSSSSSSDSSDNESHKKSGLNVNNQNEAKPASEAPGNTLTGRNEKENGAGKDTSKSAKQYHEKNKVEPKDEKSKNQSRSFRSDERDRRPSNFGRERDERSYARRERRSYDRERDRNRERERNRDRGRDKRDYVDDRRNSDLRRRRRRSRSGGRRYRDRSRDKNNDYSKSKRDNDREKGSRGGKNNYDEKTTHKMKEIKKDVDKVKGSNEVKVAEETPKVSIWEKRTVGPVFDAALERYKVRKAARGS